MGGAEVLVVDFEVTEAHTGPVLIPLFLLPMDQGVKLLNISPIPCLPACRHTRHHDKNGLNPKLKTF